MIAFSFGQFLNKTSNEGATSSGLSGMPSEEIYSPAIFGVIFQNSEDYKKL